MQILKQISWLRNSFPSPLRRLHWVAIPALAPFVIGALSPGAAAAPAGRGASPRVTRGDAIFHQRCVVCHNKQPGDTTPFGPPNLHGIFKGPSAITTKQAEGIITNGKGTMPAWGKILTPADIEDVIAYLKTLPTAPPSTTP